MVYKYGIIAVTLVVLFGAQQANATTLGDIGSNADTGYDAGRIAGYNDKQNSQEHDSKCPPNDSLVWCGSYKIGYEAGWFSSGQVKAIEDENNNNNNNDND